MTAERAIAIVKTKAMGRTRWEGQEPWLDEVLVAEIERLRAQHRHCEHCGGSWLDDGINVGCHCVRVAELEGVIVRNIHDPRDAHPLDEELVGTLHRQAEPHCDCGYCQEQREAAEAAGGEK